MSSQTSREESPFYPLSIEIVRSQIDVSEVPPAQSAQQTIDELERLEDTDTIAAITYAASEVDKVISIERDSAEGRQYLLDIFTSEQVQEMRDRIHSYLGTNVDSHIDTLTTPHGYPYYIGRLATHFASADDEVTRQFGAFERRHVDPVAKARGPKEQNSREYAMWANKAMVRQFDTFYNAGFDIEFRGPTHIAESGSFTWKRGIAESQFLVLDYVRDLLASDIRRVSPAGDVAMMTIGDVEINLMNLLRNKRQVSVELNDINPMLAQQVANSIDGLAQFTTPVLHRGKMGVPRFKREPENARRAIDRIETLLVHAAALAVAREDQAEIPILDI